jgi:hypothetical protein
MTWSALPACEAASVAHAGGFGAPPLAARPPVWSKNSCGFARVVFQEPSEPFSTVHRACSPFVCS